MSIVYPKKPTGTETETICDAFGKPIVKDLITLEYLRSDWKAKLGFYLVLLGFLIQLIGTLL